MIENKCQIELCFGWGRKAHPLPVVLWVVRCVSGLDRRSHRNNFCSAGHSLGTLHKSLSQMTSSKFPRPLKFNRSSGTWLGHCRFWLYPNQDRARRERQVKPSASQTWNCRCHCRWLYSNQQKSHWAYACKAFCGRSQARFRLLVKESSKFALDLVCFAYTKCVSACFCTLETLRGPLA